MIRTVTIGDVSDAWLVGHYDAAGNELPLNADYACKMALFDMDGQELISRAVTAKQGNSFLVFLTDTETAALQNRHQYRLFVQLENPNLTKPIKKEVWKEFQAVSGHIT